MLMKNPNTKSMHATDMLRCSWNYSDTLFITTECRN